MKQFHLTSINERISFLDNLDNSRIKEIGYRLIFRNNPESLGVDQKEKIMGEIIHPDSRNVRNETRRTPSEAKEEAIELLNNEDYDSEQVTIINDFISFIDNKND